jgi:hypothetical protein
MRELAMFFKKNAKLAIIFIKLEKAEKIAN